MPCTMAVADHPYKLQDLDQHPSYVTCQVRPITWSLVAKQACGQKEEASIGGRSQMYPLARERPPAE